MNTSSHHTPEYRYQYAGFWIRAWATLIDSLILMAIILPIQFYTYGPAYFESTQMTLGTVDILVSWVFPAVATLAFWIKKQATPGKLVIHAKIVDARTGQPATPTQLAGRYLAYFVSLVSFGLGFIWIAFSRRKQGWHDFLSGTVVVRKVRNEPEPMQFDTPQP